MSTQEIKKTLVIYTFHQANENLDYFMDHGIFVDENVTFLLVANGLEIDPSSLTMLKKYPQLHVVLRENKGLDFGAVNAVFYMPSSKLEDQLIRLSPHEITLEDPLYTHYDQFVILNGSVKGPYLPCYVEKNWVDLFTCKLSETVKISGISANFLRSGNDQISAYLSEDYPGEIFPDRIHIQSMAYCIDREALDILVRYRIFGSDVVYPTFEKKDKLIACYEVGMSLFLRKEKKSLYSFSLGQGEITHDNHRSEGDIWFFRDDHPLLETIFVKTNTPRSKFPEMKRYDGVGFL